jgi:Trypsin Inhibitor like cysteine rich domain
MCLRPPKKRISTCCSNIFIHNFVVWSSFGADKFADFQKMCSFVHPDQNNVRKWQSIQLQSITFWWSLISLNHSFELLNSQKRVKKMCKMFVLISLVASISAISAQRSLFASYPILWGTLKFFRISLWNSKLSHFSGCISRLEYYAPCGNVCEMNCATIGVYSSNAPVNCIAGCYCRPGFARNAYGQCVNQKRCRNCKFWLLHWVKFLQVSILPDRPVCPVNEVFIKCGPPCQRFCDNRPCQATVSAANPPPTGCYCKPGFSRDTSTQKCIKIKSFKCKVQRRKVLPLYFRRFWKKINIFQ